LRLWAFLGRQQ